MSKRLAKLVLVVLIAAAATLPSSVGEAVTASTCCRECVDIWLNDCMDNCGSNTACQLNCENKYYTCANRCWTQYHVSCPV